MGCSVGEGFPRKNYHEILDKNASFIPNIHETYFGMAQRPSPTIFTQHLHNKQQFIGIFPAAERDYAISTKPVRNKIIHYSLAEGDFNIHYSFENPVFFNE